MKAKISNLFGDEKDDVKSENGANDDLEVEYQFQGESVIDFDFPNQKNIEFSEQTIAEIGEEKAEKPLLTIYLTLFFPQKTLVDINFSYKFT